MATRLEITETVLDRLESTEWTLDQALSQWWWSTVRYPGGLRLSDTGADIFARLAKVPNWTFEVNRDLLVAGNLLLLDRRMTCAYSLDTHRLMPPRITLFDGQEAVLLMLYNDTKLWLDNLRTRTGQ